MLIDLHAHASPASGDLNGERLWQAGGVSMAASPALNLDLPGCGGSDANDVGGVGRCLTEVPGATSAEDVIEGIVAATARPVLGAAWASANGAASERADLAPYRW